LAFGFGFFEKGLFGPFRSKPNAAARRRREMPALATHGLDYELNHVRDYARTTPATQEESPSILYNSRFRVWPALAIHVVSMLRLRSKYFCSPVITSSSRWLWTLEATVTTPVVRWGESEAMVSMG
jgi:hypothetical protein